MKKVLSVLLISIVLAFCASALDLNINLGVVSGVGVSHDAGSWQFGLDLESSFPVFSTFNAIMAQKYEDAPFGEGFRIGSLYFFGTDIYAYYRIAGNGNLAFLAGLDIMTGTETMIKSFETVLRPTVKFSGRIGERVSLFLAAGFSLLDIMYAPGFEKPLVRIPDQNYMSILTGCRLGAAVRLD
ncbi:MAG: hypothetical protein IKR80_07815 [Spirochaetales bacterium]|nr:hypothetical protein [Spirochaetales bacterium]